MDKKVIKDGLAFRPFPTKELKRVAFCLHKNGVPYTKEELMKVYSMAYAFGTDGEVRSSISLNVARVLGEQIRSVPLPMVVFDQEDGGLFYIAFTDPKEVRNFSNYCISRPHERSWDVVNEFYKEHQET